MNNRPFSAPKSPEYDGLSPKQEAAALALARGCTLRVAAEESGAGERTLKTWTATVPAFTRRIAQLRAEMTSQALGRMIDGMSEAADTLRRLLRAKSRTVRLGAARALIELGTKLRETVELEERIAALEAGALTGGEDRMSRNLRGRLAKLEAKSEAREPARYASLWEVMWGMAELEDCDPAKLAELDEWLKTLPACDPLIDSTAYRSPGTSP
jgi:hypothetical protein